MRQRIALVLATTVVCAAATIAAGSVSAAPVTNVTIGGLCNLSGALAAFGAACQDGLNLAVDHINNSKNFTYRGTKLHFNLVVEDGRSDPAAAVAAATDLIENKHINFLFGPDTSGVSLQVAAYTRTTNVLQFSAGSAIQAVLGTPGYERVFGLVAAGSQVMGASVPVLKRIGISGGTIALVFPDDPAGNQNVGDTKKALDAAGYKSRTYLFPPGTSDFRALLSRIDGDGKPAAIIAGYSPTWLLPLGRAINASPDSTGAYIAFGGLPTQVPLAIQNETGKPFAIPFATLNSQPNLGNATTPGARRLSALYVQNVKKDPRTLFATGTFWYYDSMGLLAKAMAKAKSINNTNKIAKAVSTLHYTGALNDYHFSKKHIAVYGTDYALVRNGKVTWVFAPAPKGA
jgi:ABC-type branched-subunit amino acid transport system substrate-binding protein